MITKGDIVNGSFGIIRISGLTSQPTPREIGNALTSLDDFMAELSVSLNIPYLQPLEYGKSDPSDPSGLTVQMAGAVKKAFSKELLNYYGKPITQNLQNVIDSGMKSLTHLLVEIPKAQNPPTLPIGSGNEWDYRSDKFYPEPSSVDNPDYYFKTDSFILPIDWSSWLIEDTLTNVTYTFDSGIVLENQAFDDSNSSVKVSFSGVGVFDLCVIAYKGIAPGDEQKTKKFTYDVRNCLN